MELADVLREVEAAGIVTDLEAIPFCIVRERPDAVAELSFLAKQRRVYTPVRDETRDWRRDRILQKTQGPQCRQCCYWQICEGPWNEYVRRFGTEELRPVELDALAFGRLMRQVARPSGWDTAPGEAPAKRDPRRTKRSQRTWQLVASQPAHGGCRPASHKSPRILGSENVNNENGFARGLVRASRQTVFDGTDAPCWRQRVCPGAGGVTQAAGACSSRRSSQSPGGLRRASASSPQLAQP